MTRQRFNNHDYYLTSIFDVEHDNFDKNMFLAVPEPIYESFFDDIMDSPEWDEIESASNGVSDVVVDYKILLTDGTEHKLDGSVDDNRYKVAYFMYIRDHIILDEEYAGQYTHIDDIIIDDVTEKTYKIRFTGIGYYDSNVRFVIGSPKTRNYGLLYMKFKDNHFSEISIVVDPYTSISKKLYGYRDKSSILSYEEFSVINQKTGGFKKQCDVYYRNLVKNVIKKLTGIGVYVTLGNNVRGSINKQYFLNDAVDNTFPRKNLKAMTMFGPDKKGDMTQLMAALDEDMGQMSQMYDYGESLDMMDVKDDEYYVVLTKGNNFANAFRKSGWYNTAVPAESLIYMFWTSINGVNTVKNHAIAMPLAAFAVYAPAFYYFLANSPLV